ncbi:unnamed protein product, partial [marine sediment metagenome]
AAAPEDAVIACDQVQIDAKRGRKPFYTTTIRPATRRTEAAIVTVLYPAATGAAAPKVNVGPTGSVTVRAEGRDDTVVFEHSPAGWLLKSVNGEDASGVGTGEERTLIPFGESPR